jgi:5-methylcytosine-specific restriction enzyme A
MGKGSQTEGEIDALLEALHISAPSYHRMVAWALAEQLVSTLSAAVEADPDHVHQALWDRPDGRKRFRAILRNVTARNWSDVDEERLFDRVQRQLSKHDRKPIRAEDLFRLLWNSPHECVKCGRKPPEVKLHIDHILPASRGGSSDFGNLQFLCAECNLRKSNKIEVEDLWLSSL